MNTETTTHEQIRDLLRKAQRVLLCVNNRSSFDTHYAVVALKKYLEGEGKNATVVANGELILKHKFMFEREGVTCTTEMQPLNYVITIDHEDANIEKVSYDDKDGKFHLYITPVAGSKSFDFNNVAFSEGGGDVDLIIVFGCRSLKWMGPIYEQNTEFFTKTPVININNLSGEQEYGTVKLTDEAVSVSESVLEVIGISSLRSSKGVADLLLQGILDHFQPFQRNPYEVASVEKAFELVKAGADVKDAFKRLYFDHTFENFEVQRKVMSNFKFDQATGVAWSSVSALDLTQCGVDRNTFILDGKIIFNNCLDFKVAFVLYEVQEGEVVVELESNNRKIDAKELLSEYKVAGNSARVFFTIRDKTLADVEESVIKAISRKIELWDVSGDVKTVDSGSDIVSADERMPKGAKSSSKTAMTRSDEEPQSKSKKIDHDKLPAVSKGLVTPPPINAEEG